MDHLKTLCFRSWSWISGWIQFILVAGIRLADQAFHKVWGIHGSTSKSLAHRDDSRRAARAGGGAGVFVSNRFRG
jgi:hypothetical protein